MQGPSAIKGVCSPVGGTDASDAHTLRCQRRRVAFSSPGTARHTRHSPREEFDRISQLITLIFEVEIGIVSFIDAHRQWYKSVVGLSTREADLQDTFCKHTLMAGVPVFVPDATQDARFASKPHVVGGPQIRFYAGSPLKTADGLVVGTICAIDGTAREFGARDSAILELLAATVMHTVELRKQAATDVLTGAMSLRAFKEEAAKHLSLAARHKAPVSCIAFDLMRKGG